VVGLLPLRDSGLNSSKITCEKIGIARLGSAKQGAYIRDSNLQARKTAFCPYVLSTCVPVQPASEVRPISPAYLMDGNKESASDKIQLPNEAAVLATGNSRLILNSARKNLSALLQASIIRLAQHAPK